MQLKAQCFGTKMAAYFNDLKDEENFERRTGKLSARFLVTLNNNQNKNHIQAKFNKLAKLREAVIRVLLV